MNSFVGLLGDTPRIRLIDVLLRYGPREVGRGELARDAGLFRMSAHRALSALESDGLVVVVKAGRRPTYRANPNSVPLRLMAQLSASLRIVERRGITSQGSTQVVATFQQQTQDVLAKATAADYFSARTETFEVVSSTKAQSLQRVTTTETSATMAV